MVGYFDFFIHTKAKLYVVLCKMKSKIFDANNMQPNMKYTVRNNLGDWPFGGATIEFQRLFDDWNSRFFHSIDGATRDRDFSSNPPKLSTNFRSEKLDYFSKQTEKFTLAVRSR